MIRIFLMFLLPCLCVFLFIASIVQYCTVYSVVSIMEYNFHYTDVCYKPPSTEIK